MSGVRLVVQIFRFTRFRGKYRDLLAVLAFFQCPLSPISVHRLGLQRRCPSTPAHAASPWSWCRAPMRSAEVPLAPAKLFEQYLHIMRFIRVGSVRPEHLVAKSMTGALPMLRLTAAISLAGLTGAPVLSDCLTGRTVLSLSSIEGTITQGEVSVRWQRPYLSTSEISAIRFRERDLDLPKSADSHQSVRK